MKKHRLIIVITIASLMLVCSMGCYWAFQHQLNQPMSLHETAILRIEPGDSLTAISNMLVRRGWITHPYFVNFAGRSKDLAGSIKTGEYEIRPGLTPLQFLSLIVSGKVIQYSLTIPEGWTFKQILDAVRSNQHLQHTLSEAAPATIMDQLGHTGLHPEGRFFPDTYMFPAGTSDLEFLQRSYNTMAKVLAEEWQQRAPDLPYQDAYQVLIMASIIEKETAAPDERYKIAGVFVRRLQRGIKLQTDPTVIYAF
ncbi:MAG: Endolytic murein transglycosylase [Gammaproteobacteria bacterium]|nr:Endolytic murein transglycosylase [Gammaproteobacteria bacterium]